MGLQAMGDHAQRASGKMRALLQNTGQPAGLHGSRSTARPSQVPEALAQGDDGARSSDLSTRGNLFSRHANAMWRDAIFSPQTLAAWCKRTILISNNIASNAFTKRVVLRLLSTLRSPVST
jgi:hypothetical protein